MKGRSGKLASGRYFITVDAFFDPTRSYVHPKAKSSALLSHEQGHFDLAEVYARKIKKAALQRLRSSEDLKKGFKPLFDAYYAQYLKEQEKYDTKTRKGTHPSFQKAYELWIERELKQLQHFKSTTP